MRVPTSRELAREVLGILLFVRWASRFEVDAIVARKMGAFIKSASRGNTAVPKKDYQIRRWMMMMMIIQ